MGLNPNSKDRRERRKHYKSLRLLSIPVGPLRRYHEQLGHIMAEIARTTVVCVSTTSSVSLLLRRSVIFLVGIKHSITLFSTLR